MIGGRALIVVGGIGLAAILGLSAALALSVQQRGDMAERHRLELGDARRARAEGEAELDALRAELESAQAKIVALQSTLEEIRTQIADLDAGVSSRSAPSPMAPLFLRQNPAWRGASTDE